MIESDSKIELSDRTPCPDAREVDRQEQTSMHPHDIPKSRPFSFIPGLAIAKTWRVLAACAFITLVFGGFNPFLRSLSAIAVPRAELIAIAATPTQISLFWTITDAGLFNTIQVYRSTSATGNFELIRSATSKTTNHNDLGLQPNTTYYYQLKLKNSSGVVILTSNVASAKTVGGDGAPTPTPTITVTPTPSPTTTPVTVSGIFVAPNGSSSGDGSINRPYDLASALAGKSNIRPGDTVWLRGGTYSGSFTGSLNGTQQSLVTVRQYPGERAIIDGVGSANPTFTINGSYAVYWGFEITNSTVSRSVTRPEGLVIFGHHTKAINLIIHDTGNGVGFWTPAIDSEVYGCVIYRNGWQGPSPDRGHGHGLYGQNAEGTKRIVDNVIFDQYGYGIHNYGQAGEIKGFYLEGNVVFGNGSMATPDDTDDPNILVGGYKPSERIALVNNFTYHPFNKVASNVILNYDAKGNKDVLLQGNYFAGGVPLSMSEWIQATVTKNTFIAAGELLILKMPTDGSTPNYIWDNNTYHTNNSTSASPFNLTSQGRNAIYGFTGWQQAASFDANSQVIRSATGKPSGIKVFVRPNAYERGRANIAVYNWDGASTVDVNLSNVIAPGERYEIRSVYNYFGQPVASGAFDGNPVRLSMSGARTSPEFNVFVLTSQTTASPNPTSTPSPKPSPSPSPAPTPTPTPTPNNPNPQSGSATAIPLDAEEQKLLDLINNYRRQYGLNPLNPSISLTNAGDWLARDMATFNYVNKIDSLGRDAVARAKAFGFPTDSSPVDENASVAASPSSGDFDAQQIFDYLKNSAAENQLLLAKSWRSAGIARSRGVVSNRWLWAVSYGAYWDRSIPLAGEDEEGRIDGNELIRTRPPTPSLNGKHTITGYGEDGMPYNPIHCDFEIDPPICWHDPPKQDNSRLAEISSPLNLAGSWRVGRTISPAGVVHENMDGWDRTGYLMEIQISPYGTWTSRGYRVFQSQLITESGTWQSTHDDARNEEVFTFNRQNSLPRATIRIHAAKGQLTFFATDGGSFMKNFLRGIIADDNPKDDPQIIFISR